MACLIYVGGLSNDIPSTAISSVNKQVTAAWQAQLRTKKRGKYHQLSPGDCSRVGWYACENGLVATAWWFSRGINKALNESTPRGSSELTLLRQAWNGEPRKMSASANCQPRIVGNPCFLEATSKVQYRNVYERYASVGELSIHLLLSQVLRASSWSWTEPDHLSMVALSFSLDIGQILDPQNGNCEASGNDQEEHDDSRELWPGVNKLSSGWDWGNC